MTATDRRTFLRKSSLAAGFTATAPGLIKNLRADSPAERINVAVVGFHGRGQEHYKAFAAIPNVRVTTLCDVDERLFPDASAEVESLTGFKPRTEVDVRKVLEDKELNAIAIATPDHWHALMTIWACQAGKDVYVEKPVSFNIEEGRKMVEAARKYNRIVQAGLNRRSDPESRAAISFLQAGKLGNVYRSKALILKGRGSIGVMKDSPVPQGVNWDLFLGPAPMRPFNLNRFHYGWHFFWDTSTTDCGNTGVHHLDMCRWGMNKQTHPVRIHCTGGLYVWDSDQETPNIQAATFEYEDGTLMEVEVSNLYTPDPGSFTEIFYTSKGYLTSGKEWSPAIGEFQPRTPDLSKAGVWERPTNVSFPKRSYTPGPEIPPTGEQAMDHFSNFIACVRSRKREDLYCEMLEGHMSTSLCHLANISFRTGRKLQFDPKTERFVNDKEADAYLTRQYREPFVVPKEV